MVAHKSERGILIGLKEISTHVGLSDDVVLNLIRVHGFPCRKTSGNGGVWISSKAVIDAWAEWFCKAGGCFEEEIK